MFSVFSYPSFYLKVITREKVLWTLILMEMSTLLFLPYNHLTTSTEQMVWLCGHRIIWSQDDLLKIFTGFLPRYCKVVSRCFLPGKLYRCAKPILFQQWENTLKKKKKIIFQNTQLRAGQKRGQNMKTVGFRMVKAYVRVYAKKSQLYNKQNNQ